MESKQMMLLVVMNLRLVMENFMKVCFKAQFFACV